MKSLCTFFYKKLRFLGLTRVFGQKDKKRSKKLEASNLKTETILKQLKEKYRCPICLCFSMAVHSIDLYNNASQPVFFLTQHFGDVV